MKEQAIINYDDYKHEEPDDKDPYEFKKLNRILTFFCMVLLILVGTFGFMFIIQATTVNPNPLVEILILIPIYLLISISLLVV